MAIAYSLDSMYKPSFRIGYGEDIHRLVSGRKLILAGVDIPFELGLDGHSDADVVYHALSDSLLTSLGLGDIGKYYPPNDDRCLNMDSSIILRECYERVLSQGYRLCNCVVHVITEKPKLKNYIEQMRINIAKTLNVDIELVAVSAGTNEKLDEVGQGKAIRAVANVLVERIQDER